MTPRDKAVGGIAVVEFLIRNIERELAEAHQEADALGSDATVEAIEVAQAKVRHAHKALEAVREQLAVSFGSPNETRSGGDADDKDTPTP